MHSKNKNEHTPKEKLFPKVENKGRIIKFVINYIAYVFFYFIKMNYYASLVKLFDGVLIGEIGKIGLEPFGISPLAPIGVLTNWSLLNVRAPCPLGLKVSTAPTSTKSNKIG
jgi:hypothetical protein